MHTILIVDDEKDLLGLICLLLERQGFLALSASNAAQAIKILEKNDPAPSILITDVMMPEMNGCELASYAKKLRPELNIIFITACRHNELSKLGVLDFGAQIICKPFKRKLLLNTIKKILGIPTKETLNSNNF